MLKELQPSLTMTNNELMEFVARSINGDLIDAIDAILGLLDEAGWEWRKPENYHGAVIDNTGMYHLLHFAQSFPDAVAEAFRLLQQFRVRGWLAPATGE